MAALSVACRSQGMRPYPEANEGLGAGTMYDGSQHYPTPASLVCQNVFSGMRSDSSNSVATQALTGTQSGTIQRDGKFGISFLKGLLGPKADAKVDLSLANGNKWELTTGGLTTEGQTIAGVIKFKASPGACVQGVQKSLGKRQRMNVFLLYQTAKASTLKYKVTTNGNVGANLSVNVADLVSINPGYTVTKTSDSELSVSGQPVNVCYAWKKYRLSPSTMVGPGNFVLKQL